MRWASHARCPGPGDLRWSRDRSSSRTRRRNSSRTRRANARAISCPRSWESLSQRMTGVAHRPGALPTKTRAARRARPARFPARCKSLTRGLSILECLAKAEGGAPYADRDTGQRVQLPPSTIHRLLATLEKMGYVTRRASWARWYVGLQAFTVGSSFPVDRDFVAQSHPYMRRLMDQSGRRRVNLAHPRDGTGSRLRRPVQCREMMRTIVKLGSRACRCMRPAWGKANLRVASRRPDRCDPQGPRPAAHHRQHDHDAGDDVGEYVRVIRQRGWSFDDEEHAIGTRCVGAPHLRRARGNAGRALARRPVVAAADERIKQLGPLVAHTAEELTHRLGGKPFTVGKNEETPKCENAASRAAVTTTQYRTRQRAPGRRFGVTAPEAGADFRVKVESEATDLPSSPQRRARSRAVAPVSSGTGDRRRPRGRCRQSTMSQPAAMRRVGARDDVARALRAGHVRDRRRRRARRSQAVRAGRPQPDARVSRPATSSTAG